MRNFSKKLFCIGFVLGLIAGMISFTTSASFMTKDIEPLPEINPTPVIINTSTIGKEFILMWSITIGAIILVMGILGFLVFFALLKGKKNE